MKSSNALLWNTDSQSDLVESEDSSKNIDVISTKKVLAKITKFAKDKQINIVNTADAHNINCSEFHSSDKESINTFTSHCLEGSQGAKLIPEAELKHTSIFKWEESYNLPMDVYLGANKEGKSILIKKDTINPFISNRSTKDILNYLNPDQIFIYGVYCDGRIETVAKDIIDMGFKVTIFADAVFGKIDIDRLTEIGVKIEASNIILKRDSTTTKKLFNNGIVRDIRFENRERITRATTSYGKH